jgi:hypothetical protein
MDGIIWLFWVFNGNTQDEQLKKSAQEVFHKGWAWPIFFLLGLLRVVTPGEISARK